MKNIKQKVRIVNKIELAPDIYRMSFETTLCNEAKPGQFVMVYPPDGSKLLGRPICIADVLALDKDNKTAKTRNTQSDENSKNDVLTIVFRTVGNGTREIASCDIGDELYIEGPLGHGYPVEEEIIKGKDIVLLGGGLGAPSLLYLAKILSGQAGRKYTVAENAVPKPSNIKSLTAILGYRDSGLNHFLAEDFKALGIKTMIATDDGSEGIHGNVLDALKQSGIQANLIYACGPMPMLSAIKKYAGDQDIKAYVSLEEHMACGVGVCLGCVTKTTKIDGHSHVKNARVCTEGPVFDAEDVDI